MTTVFYVEDNPSHRMRIESRIKALGIGVLTATNLKEAKEIIVNEWKNIDFAIIDLKLPVLPAAEAQSIGLAEVDRNAGFELMNDIRKYCHESVIIIITTQYDLDEERFQKKPPGVHYISKRTGWEDELVKQLENQIGSSQIRLPRKVLFADNNRNQTSFFADVIKSNDSFIQVDYVYSVQEAFELLESPSRIYHLAIVSLDLQIDSQKQSSYIEDFRAHLDKNEKKNLPLGGLQVIEKIKCCTIVTECVVIAPSPEFSHLVQEANNTYGIYHAWYLPKNGSAEESTRAAKDILLAMSEIFYRQEKEVITGSGKIPLELDWSLRCIIGNPDDIRHIISKISNLWRLLKRDKPIRVIIKSKSPRAAYQLAKSIIYYLTKDIGNISFSRIDCDAIRDGFAEQRILGSGLKGYLRNASNGAAVLYRLDKISISGGKLMEDVFRLGQIPDFEGWLAVDLPRILIATVEDFDDLPAGIRNSLDDAFIWISPLGESNFDDFRFLVNSFLFVHSYREKTMLIGMDASALDMLFKRNWPEDLDQLWVVLEESVHRAITWGRETIDSEVLDDPFRHAFTAERLPYNEPMQEGDFKVPQIHRIGEISREDIELLKNLFRGKDLPEHGQIAYDRISVKPLSGGFSGARLYVVVPVINSILSYPRVVKIDFRENMETEDMHYRAYVDPYLHARWAARIIAKTDNPSAKLGAVVYTMVLGLPEAKDNKWDVRDIMEFKDFYAQQSIEKVIECIELLFKRVLYPVWYGQSRPLASDWREIFHKYLPAVVTISSEGFALGKNNLASQSEYEIVDSERIRMLSFDKNSKIKINGLKVISLVSSAEYDNTPMEIIKALGPSKARVDILRPISSENIRIGTEFSVQGTIVSTQDTELEESVVSAFHPGNTSNWLLNKGKLVLNKTINFIEYPDKGAEYPNPLYYAMRTDLKSESLLEKDIQTKQSIIHGDANLRNILVDGQGNPSLIDFAHTDWGYAILDFVKFETDLCMDCWSTDSSSGGIQYDDFLSLQRCINSGKEFQSTDNENIGKAYSISCFVRELAYETLGGKGKEKEYLTALCLMYLSLLKYKGYSAKQRRYAFAAATLACSAIMDLPV